MKATTERIHKDQEEVTVITVTLASGQKQEFIRFDSGDEAGRVYAGLNFWPAEQFAAGVAKMIAAGATVTESAGFAWGEAK